MAIIDTLDEERIVLSDPTQHSNLSTHAMAYSFALPYVQGKTVLDLCCGTGYGSKLLAEAAKSVVGVDYSQTAINYADRWKPGNCSFVIGNTEEQTFGQPETVVCMQGLEHLDYPKKVIDRYPQATWVFAVPMGQDSGNPHHHHDIGYDTLQDWFGDTLKVWYMADGQGIYDTPPEVFQNYFGVRKC